MPVAEKHDQNNAIEQQANITSVPIQLEQQKKCFSPKQDG
jgi:hypothetical protein